MVTDPGADPSERRAFERVTLEVEAELFVPQPDGSAVGQPVTVSDISEGGVKLHSRTPLDPGAQMRLHLMLPPAGDEVDLDLLVLSVVPTGDGQAFAAHCSFVDIPLRTLWQVVGACLALNGDTASAEQLSNWSGPRSISLNEPELAVTAGPSEEATSSQDKVDVGVTSWINPDGARVAAARLVWPERDPEPIATARGTADAATPDVAPPTSAWARSQPESAEPVREERPDEPAALHMDADRGTESPNAGGTCDHCASRDLQLQRMSRNDAVLESWWLCGACGRLSHRIQPADAASREEPGLDERPISTGRTDPAVAPSQATEPAWRPETAEPAVSAESYSDFGSALKRVLAEEAIVANEAARLRAELARAEQDLHDLQLLPQLLGRMIREREIR
jgi:hypothetical protein